jgi:hypothetical protein
MDDGIRPRYPILAGISHAIAFIGICVAVLMWLLVVSELASWFPSCYLTEGGVTRSPVRELFGDQGEFSQVLGMYFVFLILIYLVSEKVVARPTSVRMFHVQYPAVTASCLTVLFIITAYLFLRDFAPGMYEFVGEPNPYFRTMIVALPALTIGLYAIIMYLTHRRLVYLRIYAVVPLLSAMLLSFLATADFWENEYHLTLPFSFPRAWITALELSVIILLYFVFSWAWHRKTRNRADAGIGLVIAGPFAWILLALLCFCYIKALHITPVGISRYDDSQLAAAMRVLYVFIALCCCIVAVQVIRYMRLKRSMGENNEGIHCGGTE